MTIRTLCLLGLIGVCASAQMPPPPKAVEKPKEIQRIRVGDPTTYWICPASSLQPKAEYERRVQANPEDICARGELIAHILDHAEPSEIQARVAHMWWMIEHHPEWDGFTAPPRDALDRSIPPDGVDQLKQAWMKQIGADQKRAIVLHNAAMFFAVREPELAVALLKRAMALEPEERLYAEHLGTIYVLCLSPARCASAGLYKDVRLSPAFLSEARETLQESDNWALLAGGIAALNRKAGPCPIGVDLDARMHAIRPEGNWLGFDQQLPSRLSPYCHSACYPEPGGPSLLDQVRKQMALSVSRLPNYTCLETVTRTMRHKPSEAFQPVDKLRFDVAYVNGREMIAWPGEGAFSERRIDELTSLAGALRTGEFAAQLRDLAGDAPSFAAHAEGERCEGRRCTRRNFFVPRSRSGLTIQAQNYSAPSAYEGSFWTDQESHDLLRIESRAIDIPKESGIVRNFSTITYARQQIGGADFLLPRTSELTVAAQGGTEYRNTVEFSGCRQYVGESKLTFGDTPAEAAPVPKEPLRFPQGLLVEAALDTPVNTKHVAIGDRIAAHLLRPAKKGSTVYAPNGATITGHITRWEQRAAATDRVFIVGMQFTTIEAEGRHGDFLATFDEFGTPRQYWLPFAKTFVTGPESWDFLRNMIPPPAPGEGVFITGTDKNAIPAGLHMVLYTQ